jgi:hypothetical protein
LYVTVDAWLIINYIVIIIYIIIYLYKYVLAI